VKRGAVLALVVAACAPSSPAPIVIAPVAVSDAGAVEPVARPASATGEPRAAEPITEVKLPGGKTAPNFELPSYTSRGKVTVAAGKVTIVDFWATWCEPCKKSFPRLQALHAKYEGRGLAIAAVSVDDESRGVLAFARQYGAAFPVGWDEGLKVANAWGPETMPSTYVVDRHGVVRYVHKGWNEGDESLLERELLSLL
jgi:thiol-disulfide isomerase/thioredoxin